MLRVKHKRDVILDEQYPYLQKGAWFRIKRGFLWVMLNGIVFPLMRLSHGLRIYGKDNLKQHKDALKNGGFTISNHVFMWDYLCVLKVIRPHLAYFPAWKTNLEGSNAGLIRMAGGIPIPDGNLRAMMKFKAAMEEVMESDGWMHFFPEGSLWFYYPDIRPLKPAVFKYAVRYDKPVIPMSMSFRPRKGIWKWLGRKPLVDMHVGEPLFADKTLSPAEATRKLQAEAYRVMQEMNGIHPGDPTYNTDQNPMHYQKTM